MKTEKFLLLLSIFAFQSTRALDSKDIEIVIKKNRIALIEEYLKTHALSPQEKNRLLACANYNVRVRKEKISISSHTTGLRRKWIGILGAINGTSNLFFGKAKGWVGLLGGLALYKWGEKAAKNKTIESKLHRIAKHEQAIAIKKLLDQITLKATTSDSTLTT